MGIGGGVGGFFPLAKFPADFEKKHPTGPHLGIFAKIDFDLQTTKEYRLRGWWPSG